MYAGDRMSDLLERARPDTLLVTRLANPHLFRMAELMDVPAVCLVLGEAPGPELLQAADASGIALLGLLRATWNRRASAWSAACRRGPRR